MNHGTVQPKTSRETELTYGRASDVGGRTGCVRNVEEGEWVKTGCRPKRARGHGEEKERNNLKPTTSKT